jgi:hypothetical protein
MLREIHPLSSRLIGSTEINKFGRYFAIHASHRNLFSAQFDHDKRLHCAKVGRFAATSNDPCVSAGARS